MESARYEFGLLGPLAVRRDGEPIRIGAAKLRVLLVALLLEAGRVITVETLIDRLWGGDPPGRPHQTLQNYVWRLRRALGPDGAQVVCTRPRGYLVEVRPEAVDLHRFDALVERGRAALGAGAAGHAATLLEESLALWRGEPLSDLPPELVRDVVPGLVERRLGALESRIDADLALGRSAEVLPELLALIGAHPLRERFWAQRMRALAQCGRHGEALECYRQVAALLAEELGIDPGAELRDLQRRVLAAAPELEAAPGRGVSGVGNLPAETTSFVGRRAQMAEVRRALESSRLVTLTGVGGVGKTRLALRVAAESAPGFPDGVWLAEWCGPDEVGWLLRMRVAETEATGAQWAGSWARWCAGLVEWARGAAATDGIALALRATDEICGSSTNCGPAPQPGPRRETVK